MLMTNQSGALELLALAAHALETPGDFTPEEMENVKGDVGAFLAGIEASGDPASAMRVKTWRGLRPIAEFDEVEVHEMKEPEDEPNELWQASDCDDDTSVCAYSVFLHCREGGIECVQDFRFDPSEPGAADEAKAEADMLAEQLYGMLRVSGVLLPMPEAESQAPKTHAGPQVINVAAP